MGHYKLSKQSVVYTSYDEQRERELEAERIRFRSINAHIDAAIRLAMEQWPNDEYAFVSIMGMVHTRHTAYQKVHPVLPRPKPYTKQNIPPTLRWAVWERDDFTCRHCGTRQHLAVDHIIPESKGGATTLKNLQTLCKNCNSRKKDRMPVEDSDE